MTQKEMQDQNSPKFDRLVQKLEEKDRMARKLKVHREIERENDQKYREWKDCQQAH